MELEERYTNLLQNIGFSQENTALHWSQLKRAYTHKSRYYHNLNHLQEMITCFDAYKNQLQHSNEVLYALFYHDFIYKTTSKDNELKSAQHAIKILPANTFINKQLVFDCIIATKDHTTNGTEDEKWLIDFDLRILAKDFSDYLIYAKQIRKEYSIFPDFMYNPGRKKALQHFLEKETIYQTETFRMQFETRAKTNILKEITQL